VQVIRKNDITPHCNAKIALRACAKLHECLMNMTVR
jgi:hypothetical protein